MEELIERYAEELARGTAGSPILTLYYKDLLARYARDLFQLINNDVADAGEPDAS